MGKLPAFKAHGSQGNATNAKEGKRGEDVSLTRALPHILPQSCWERRVSSPPIPK